MTIGTAADLIDKSIQRIAVKITNSVIENYKDYYHTETTEDYYDKDSSISGFSEAGRITESAIIVSESPVQGFDKTYQQVFFGLIGSFTMQEWKFGIKKRKLEKVVRDLDRACRVKREKLTTGYLEASIANGSTMTIQDPSGNYSKSVTGGDSQEMIDSSHTREDGGTAWSNVIGDGTTSNMDFAYDALKAAGRTGQLVTDPKGNQMDIDYDTFVFKKKSPISYKAMEINAALKSGKIPESADNDGSGASTFSILQLPYLTAANQAYWWGFDSTMKDYDMGLQYRESQGITFEGPDVEFKTGTIYYKSYMAYDFGHNDGRMWSGSTGANA